MTWYWFEREVTSLSMDHPAFDFVFVPQTLMLFLVTEFIELPLLTPSTVSIAIDRSNNRVKIDFRVVFDDMVIDDSLALIFVKQYYVLYIMFYMYSFLFYYDVIEFMSDRQK